jgi:beta-ribofuranosylaminobenzene 5'-phosphate synthase
MGLGASISWPRWIIKAHVSARNSLRVAPQADQPATDVVRAAKLLLPKLSNALRQPGFSVEILESVPSHCGLGAKTSLLCGITAATAAVADAPRDWPSYRQLTRRGGTSGIGANTAVHGGVILDAGHTELGPERVIGPSRQRAGRPIPHVAARWELRKWPFLLIIPSETSELHGRRESELFRASTPIPSSEAKDLSAIVLYDLIPALAAHNKSRTYNALQQLQHIGFKRREWDAQPGPVCELRAAIMDAGADCVALSSMGPAMAVFSPNIFETWENINDVRNYRVGISSIRNVGISRWYTHK